MKEWKFLQQRGCKVVKLKSKKEEKMEKVTIYIPESGAVKKFEVDVNEYDVKIWEIDRSVESQALHEMIAETGATHQGRISFKDGKKGSIEELNEIIEIIDKGDGVAFYSIIK